MCVVLVYEGNKPVVAKLLAYNDANRAVAVLCNHQRVVPKNFRKQMENLQAKVSLACHLHHIGISSTRH